MADQKNQFAGVDGEVDSGQSFMPARIALVTWLKLIMR